MARIAMGVWGISVSMGVVGGLVATSAHGFVQMRTDGGRNIEWPRSSETASFRNNYVLIPANRTGLDAATVKASVVRSLERWQEAGLGNFQFDVWTGSDSSVYRAGTANDGYSKIYFSSQTSNSQLGQSVIGYTQVWFEANSGRILEADMELNDVGFAFTTTVSDSTGTGNGMNTFVTADGRRKVFIENVLTHELGHTLGVGHSGVMQSTMLAVEAPAQFRLSCDDRVALQSMYPVNHSLGARGALSGVVVSEFGQPVIGAQVAAISRRRGVLLAAGLSDRNGNFYIDGLEAGDYAVMVDPFGAGPTAVPAYYGGMNPKVCSGGTSFVRSFQTVSGEAQGPLQFSTVTGGRAQDVGRVLARCSTPMNTGVVPVLSSGGGLVLGGDSQDVTLTHSGGALEIKVLAHSLFYAKSVVVDLLDSSGRPVSDFRVVYPSFVSSSGYRNFDAHGRASNLPAGTYVARVRLGALSATWIPGAQLGQSSSSAFAIFAISSEGNPALVDELPWNARCEAADVDTHYVSPAGLPPRNGGGVLGCGTMQKIGNGGAGAGGGNALRDAASWFLSLGWIFALSAARLRRAWTRAII